MMTKLRLKVKTRFVSNFFPLSLLCLSFDSVELFRTDVDDDDDDTEIDEMDVSVEILLLF